MQVTAVQWKLNRAIWFLLTLTNVLCLLFLHHHHIRIDFSKSGLYLFLLILLAYALFFARYLQRNDGAVITINVFGQIIFASLALLLLSYVGALFNYALIDDKLAASDHAMGFDWQRYARFFVKGLFLAKLLGFSYSFYGIILFSIFFLLLLFNEFFHAQRVIIGYVFAVFATGILSTFYPAGGVVYYTHFDNALFRATHTCGGYMKHIPEYFSLRNNTIKALYWPAELGLITFPSFHAVIAVFYIYASLPLRYFRCALIPINLLMLLSIPVCGAHYLTDILAGIAISLVGIALTEYFYKPPNVAEFPCRSDKHMKC